MEARGFGGGVEEMKGRKAAKGQDVVQRKRKQHDRRQATYLFPTTVLSSPIDGVVVSKVFPATP